MFISSNSPSCRVIEVTLTCDKTTEANYIENKNGTRYDNSRENPRLCTCGEAVLKDLPKVCASLD